VRLEPGRSLSADLCGEPGVFRGAARQRASSTRPTPSGITA
jgi:hypothetical protein